MVRSYFSSFLRSLFLPSPYRLLTNGCIPCDMATKGFICGIISQDHDLEEMYLDSFLTIASIESDHDILKAIEKLDIISEKYKVRFILSVSKDKSALPECAKAKVVVSL